ncbi:hypothetical protein FJY68_00850 [candidate division WOR-3 bacterium]|uniref:Porin n=1 Tax=candidate division WOR-3 bacterium TaxID=2052148 RepID=A0A937XDR5_UNCW3|nr:hypothetical protein [candidate division WOR-3 bacterium]
MTRHATGCGARLLLVVTAAGAWAATLDFNGRASGWLGASRDSSYRVLAGLRYLPEARFSTPIGEQFAFDAEASVNALLAADVRSRACSLAARLKPYRGFVRLSSSQFEARAGLQKINFGSATLLRPLMWFDRVDPRDPLELTDGVYGLLGRYYFQNNINVWAWGLLGNSAAKGWEQLGAVRWKPELGGRVQVPFPRGEAAATYHHRIVDYHHVVKIPEALDEQDEDRFAVDTKVDIGIGLWVEGALSRETRRLDYKELPPMWTRAAVVGADYTFGIGSGLGVMAEHMLVGSASEPFGRGTDVQLSALMLGLPLGLLDNLRGMVYYDWTNHDPYSYLGWQRTLDNWVFSVGAFWNPDTPVSLGAPGGGAAGKGIQLTVVFNH